MEMGMIWTTGLLFVLQSFGNDRIKLGSSIQLLKCKCRTSDVHSKQDEAPFSSTFSHVSFMNIFSVVKYWLNQGQKTWFSSIFEGWKNHQPLSLLSRYCVFLFFLFFCFSSEHSHVFFSLLGHDLALIFN